MIDGELKLKNYKKFFKEDKILLCCARVTIDTKIKDTILSLVNEDLDWQHIFEMASIHRLTPLLYYNLNSVCPDMIPDEILVELKECFQINTWKNLSMTGELIKILELLDNHGINAIPYKGPILADLAYGNLAMREFDDIDILINKSDALILKNLMLNNGYKLDIPIKIKDTLYLNIDSEYRFFNKNNTIRTEINWNFEGIFFSFPFNPGFLFNDLKMYNFNGYKIKIFSPVNHLLILCIHSAKHDWKRLSWICDISEFLKHNKNINWDEVFEKAEKLSIKRLVIINLILANDLFQWEVPDKMLKEIKSDNIAIKLSNEVKCRIFNGNKPLKLFNKFIIDIRKRDKLQYGLKDSIYGLFKPSYADFQLLPLPEHLFGLYYLIRPFLLLKRYK